MPSFALTAHAPAVVEDVWKLLHDPARFPDWWAGVETVRQLSPEMYTMWPAGYPDFPMEQRLLADKADRRVTISCLVSDLEFRWQLLESGEETDIEVHVELPEKEAHRLPAQREILSESLDRLVALAGAAV